MNLSNIPTPLPCPFCGAQPIWHDRGPYVWHLHCVGPLCVGPHASESTERRTVAAWNRRVGTPRLYVAGPITLGDRAVNIRAAIAAAEEAVCRGWLPHVPHLNAAWEAMFQHAYDHWMAIDRQWLECCHALLRLPGESAGSDQEVAWATARGLPVYHGLETLPSLQARTGVIT